MTKLYLISIFTLLFLAGVSQNYSYLNASSGNDGEFPVDKDTSMYMFYGNLLIKTDKNLNVIWANTYSGVSFSNLLLSKTGSIYFTGGPGRTYFGKLNSNGSISWIRSATVTYSSSTNSLDCQSIFLDRNNNLVITSVLGYLMKTDTLGNLIKLRNMGGVFTDNFSIIADSSGSYKLIGGGMPAVPCMGVTLYTYSDLTDTYTNQKVFAACNPPYSGFTWNLVRSRYNENFYINMHLQSSPNDVYRVQKFNIHGQIKTGGINLGEYYSGTYRIGERVVESNNGDLLYSMSTSNSAMSYSSAIVKVDSNGVATNPAMSMLNGYNIGFSFSNIPTQVPHVICDNNYYFEVYGGSFPSNPLTVQKFNAGMSYSCSAVLSYSNGSGGLTFFPTPSLPASQPVTSYTIATITSSVTPATFSINTAFCTVLGINELNNEKNLSIYPNPVSDNLNISAITAPDVSEIYDVNGRLLIRNKATSIDVSGLPNGIYFLRVRISEGEFNKKFVKE